LQALAARRCGIPYAGSRPPFAAHLRRQRLAQSYDITEDDIARSRRAYFANISYLDDKIAELLDVLDRTRQEAIVVFVSDHGDMLGERGCGSR
jgi:arylsulfatase A-like enzyme